VIAGRRKSTVYVINRAYPGVADVAIGKVGVPSVSGGYGAADTFSDIRICFSTEDMPRMCLCLVSVFRRRPSKLPKNQFLEKSDP